MPSDHFLTNLRRTPSLTAGIPRLLSLLGPIIPHCHGRHPLPLYDQSALLGGAGAAAQTAKLVFFLANFGAGMLGHVAPATIGLPMELMNIIFLVCGAVALPAQIALYRCFFLDYPFGQALAMTASAVFFSFVFGGVCAPYFGINDFSLPSSLIEVNDSFKANEASAAHHMFGEAVFMLVMLSWFTMTPSAKAHTA